MTSKRHVKNNQCEGKVKFATKQDATQNKFQMNTGRQYLDTVDVYFCTFCNSFHLGHIKRIRSKNVRKWKRHGR